MPASKNSHCFNSRPTTIFRLAESCVICSLLSVDVSRRLSGLIWLHLSLFCYQKMSVVVCLLLSVCCYLSCCYLSCDICLMLSVLISLLLRRRSFCRIHVICLLFTPPVSSVLSVLSSPRRYMVRRASADETRLYYVLFRIHVSTSGGDSLPGWLCSSRSKGRQMWR